MSELIKSGSKGPAVKALQTQLVSLGFGITADGAFGPKTKEAVEELQLMFGYTVDGIVGPGTLKLIDKRVADGFRADRMDCVKRGLEAQGKGDDGQYGGAALLRTLKRGLEGSDVKFLQRRLQVLGCSVDGDGKFGPATEEAVKKVQAARGYDVDGIVGPATNKMLNVQIMAGFDVNKAAPNA